MKIAVKIFGIVVALALLGGFMAYLAGFFAEKIPVDFSGVVPIASTTVGLMVIDRIIRTTSGCFF